MRLHDIFEIPLLTAERVHTSFSDKIMRAESGRIKAEKALRANVGRIEKLEKALLELTDIFQSQTNELRIAKMHRDAYMSDSVDDRRKVKVLESALEEKENDIAALRGNVAYIEQPTKVTPIYPDLI